VLAFRYVLAPLGALGAVLSVVTWEVGKFWAGTLKVSAATFHDA
jgi:hypothetical protein